MARPGGRGVRQDGCLATIVKHESPVVETTRDQGIGLCTRAPTEAPRGIAGGEPRCAGEQIEASLVHGKGFLRDLCSRDPGPGGGGDERIGACSTATQMPTVYPRRDVAAEPDVTVAGSWEARSVTGSDQIDACLAREIVPTSEDQLCAQHPSSEVSRSTRRPPVLERGSCAAPNLRIVGHHLRGAPIEPATQRARIVTPSATGASGVHARCSTRRGPRQGAADG